LQRDVHAAMERHTRGTLVCHRRFGKTVLSVNQLIKSALRCKRDRPRFGYIAPTYRQGKSVAWDYIQHYARPVPGMVANQSELRVDFPHNGGQVRIYGGDNPDSLRGLYFDGVVLDEYGLHPPKVFTEVVAPALSDRSGWALFIGTPNGRNQFYEMAQMARAQQDAGNPDWHFAEHKASQTGYVSDKELAAARAVMTADEYEQEYECSFAAAVRGAIYSKELEQARADGRICSVPYEPILPVDTVWDLGVGDATAIWFVQSLRGGEVRVIDFYEASGEGLPHYAAMLSAKGYVYGKHVAPHDIQVKEFASGRSRLETAKTLGIAFAICPSVSIDDGIHAARLLLPKCYFDAKKCEPGLQALQHYRKDYNARLNEFKPTPVHDWASHTADAFRYLAVWHKTPAKPDAPVPAYVPRGRWG
jgi:phage terminase large subunit